MKRLHFIFIAALTLFFTLISLPASQAAAKLKADIRFNKLAYRPADEISIKGTIKPLSDIFDVRASLKIGPKDQYYYSRTFYLGNLKKGQKQTFEFNKNSTQNLGLKLGSNPILVEVTEKQKPIYKFSANLGLVNSDEKSRMKLALAINLAHRPHLNMNKKLTHKEGLKELFPVIEKYQKMSLANKGYINYVFSPLLAEALRSSKSQNLLNTFTKLFRQNISEIVLTSYSEVDKNRLSAESLADQFEKGKSTLGGIFSKKITAGRYTAYPGQKLVRVHSGRKYYLPATEEELTSSNKMTAVMSTLAKLSLHFNNDEKQMVLITGRMASPANIGYFIKAAKREDWLTLKPLPQLETRKLKDNPNESKKITGVLGRARLKYFALKKALASDNPAFNQAQMAIYLAEDKNNGLVESRQLAIKADRLLQAELGKIALKLSPLTLTGREGKLPIKIVNGTSSKLNLGLEIRTDGLEKRGKKKVFLINPKDNLLSIPVKVLKSGRHRVLVQLKSGKVVVASKYFLVSTSLPGVFWYYSALFLALIILLVIGAFYVRARRSKAASGN